LLFVINIFKDCWTKLDDIGSIIFWVDFVEVGGFFTGRVVMDWIIVGLNYCVFETVEEVNDGSIGNPVD
jgi:hypothetical protein